MSAEHSKSDGFRLPLLQGVLPIQAAQVPAEIVAGMTLAALAIPEVMGYTKISGTPVITGLYTILIPAALLALMAAGFLVLARLIGLGFMADFLSWTVLIGFLTGVGVQVALGEIAGMLGLKGGGHGTLQKIWTDFRQVEALNGYALSMAIIVLAVIFCSKKISPRVLGGPDHHAHFTRMLLGAFGLGQEKPGSGRKNFFNTTPRKRRSIS